MWLPPVAALTVIAAADATSGIDPWSVLLNQGPIAGLLVLFVLGKIHGPGMQKDRDEARDQLAKLNAKVIDEISPMLTRAIDAVDRASRHGRGDG